MIGAKKNKDEKVLIENDLELQDKNDYKEATQKIETDKIEHQVNQEKLQIQTIGNVIMA